MNPPVTLSLVLSHPSDPTVSAIYDGANLALPTITMPPSLSDSWRREVSHVNHAVQEQLGLRATVLRCLHIGQDATDQPTGVFLLERRDAGWTLLETARWVSPDEIPGFSAHLLITDATAHENAPWTQPGWFAEAEVWVREQLDGCGLAITGEVEQVRSWFLSCILRVQTSDGDYYLKAVPPLFGQEPVLTLDLARRYPGFVPHVVAINTERRWTLMRSIPGAKLMHHPDIERYLLRWEGILRRFAQVQLSYIARVSDLRAMGCAAVPLDTLFAAVAGLFSELPELFGEAGSLSVEEIGLLQASLPSLKVMCDDLASSGIPDTLHHGDFHSGNILCDEECVVLDWAGFVGISHPFLFLSVVSEEHQGAALARLIDAYLPAWSAYGSLDELRKLVELAVPVGWLAGALGHRRQIEITENSWDREQEMGNLLYCLKAILRLLAAL